jgi:hypothetical protein
MAWSLPYGRRAIAWLTASMLLPLSVAAADSPSVPPDAGTMASADWLTYWSTGAKSYAFDRKSVKQQPGKLELLLRFEIKDSKQLNVARIAVDCAGETFTLLSEHVEQGGRFVPLKSSVGKPIPIGTDFMRPLRNELCVTWAEPDGVMWERLGQEVDNPRLYVDRAVERNMPPGGETGVFKAHVKIIAGDVNRTYQTRIDCRNSTQEFLGGLERQFYTVKQVPEAVAPINPNSAENILKHRYCRDEIAKRGAVQQRAQEEKRRARIEQEESQQRWKEDRCNQISEKAVVIINKFTRMMNNMDTPPRCEDLDLYFDLKNLRSLGREANHAGCTNGDAMFSIADKTGSWCR